MTSWSEIVTYVGKWYGNNVKTYQGTSSNDSPNLGKHYYKMPYNNTIYNVADDCSGFVGACLKVFGVFPMGFDTCCANIMRKNGPEQTKLINAGFSIYPWAKNKLKPFDIMVNSHHTAIYYTNGKCWDWGNARYRGTHGGMPISYLPNYSIIIRLDGLSNVDFSKLDNIDTPIGGGGFTQDDYNQAMQYLNQGLTIFGKKYYVNENYETWKDQYPNLFSDSNPNINNLTIASNVDNQLIGNASTYYNEKKVSGRIYSTNDTKIILDELSLPITYKDDVYVSSDIKNNTQRTQLQSKYDRMSISDYENSSKTNTTNNKNNTSINA